jgi:hypothetical protein
MIDIQIQLTPKKQDIIRGFIEFAIEELEIQVAPKVIIQATRDGLETTAAYSPSGRWVRVYGTGRAIVDICRSISHELVHHRQNETGELEQTIKNKGHIADIGDKIEDDANAIAGQLIKKFAKQKSKVIYEGVKKVVPIDKFVKLVIDRWKKNNKIAPYELALMNVAHDYGETEQKQEFLDKMTDATMQLIENDITGFYELTLGNGYVCELFDVRGDNDPYSFFDKLLSGKDVTGKVKSPTWEEYIFDRISLSNLQMLQSYTHLNHLTVDSLQHEFPDMCHDFCHDYSLATHSKSETALVIYVISSIKKIFDGCAIKKTRSSIKITMPLSFLLTSKIFKKNLKSKLVDVYEHILDGGDGYVVRNTQQLLIYVFEEMETHGYTSLPDMFLEWAGGERPVIDIDNGVDSSVDEDKFNSLVRETIIKFFDNKY